MSNKKVKLPKVIGNKEFFAKHRILWLRCLDNRCPICDSTISSANVSNRYADSGLCVTCAKHYGHNLSRALYKYERELWLAKKSEALDRRESKLTLVSIDGNGMPVAEEKHRSLPFIIPGGRIYPPKIESSYIIENREISRPPSPKYTPKNVSEIKVRKYLAEKEAGII